MNIDFRSTLVVMRKELRDFYRDRRTFLMTLLLSPILFPAIMLGMFKLMENRASTQLEKDMTIPVAGSQYAPNLLAHLASHGIAARKASVAEVEQAVRSQEDDVGLVIDPGFGLFGKLLQHNLAMLANLDYFRQLGVPVLAGLSRKSMIGQITGRDLGGRVTGSAAAALLAVQGGAKIIRVHDVAETRDALAVLAAVQGARRRDQSTVSKPAISWPDED